MLWQKLEDIWSNFSDKSLELVLTEIAIDYRWMIVIPIVLPLSLLFEMFWRFRDFIYYRFISDPTKHDARVRSIQNQIKEYNRSGNKNPICTARPNWISVATHDRSYKDQNHKVTLNLFDILELNTDKQTVRVEPYVNSGQLTRFLIPRGWCLPVVAELEDLTIGGLVMGYGIEISSHKYGLIADSVVSMEVILGNGEVKHCSREENADLFHSLPWSQGSLGMVVSFELKIVPVKPWVKVNYYPFKNRDKMLDTFADECERPVDEAAEFVEGILFNADEGVVITADMVDEAPYWQRNAIGWFFKPWFHRHVETIMKTEQTTTEYIPLRDFYHRYARGLYWEGELIVPFGNHPLFRYTLGWLMPPKVSFLKLTQTELVREFYEKNHVIQDVLVPREHLNEGAKFFVDHFAPYPLWFCGHRLFRHEKGGLINARKDLKEGESEMFYDIGAWTVPYKKGINAKEELYRVQKWCLEHRSYQTLYTGTYMSRDEFWKMLDGKVYQTMRKKYNAEGAFMDLYDKVVKKEAPQIRDAVNNS